MNIKPNLALVIASVVAMTIASTASAGDPYSSPRHAGGLLHARANGSGVLNHAGHAGACSTCGGCDCGHGHGYGHGRLGNLHHAMLAAHHNGLPIFDPYMSADWIAQQQANTRSWHAGYYHTRWGAPLSLIVPPTARTQARYSWGVNQTTMLPIYHQFERPYPGAIGGADGLYSANPLLPTPRWPSHTDQFGVYYIRGPW